MGRIDSVAGMMPVRQQWPDRLCSQPSHPGDYASKDGGRGEQVSTITLRLSARIPTVCIRGRGIPTRERLVISSENQYDAIAEAYQDSKQLPFRKYIEAYSLFRILGNIRGATVLDLACGDGFYTRKIKQAGALEVTGVDLSAEMIRWGRRRRTRPSLGVQIFAEGCGRARVV